MSKPEGPMTLPRAKLAMLDLGRVQNYLIHRDWVVVNNSGYEPHVAIVLQCRKKCRRRHEVIIPIDSRYRDYLGRVDDIVIEIARCEGRKGWEVLEDLGKKGDE